MAHTQSCVYKYIKETESGPSKRSSVLKIHILILCTAAVSFSFFGRAASSVFSESKTKFMVSLNVTFHLLSN